MDDLDRALLNLEFAVLHVVYTPEPNNKKNAPKISHEVIEFSSSSEGTLLKDSINKAIDRNEITITFDNTLKSEIPAEISALFTTLASKTITREQQKKVVLDKSIRFAHILNDVQDARSPTGILTILYGHSNSTQVLIIAKLEEQSGLQVNEIVEKNESKLNLRMVEHLIGIRGANVFKVGLFYCKPKNDGGGGLVIKGVLADTQIQDEKKVADFYFKDFLGCKFVNDSKQQTSKFYYGTLNMISETVPSPLEQIRAHNNLAAFIQSEFELLEPKQYIEMYVPEENRTKYENYYKSKDIELNGFKKDISPIKRGMVKEKILFENGISISGASSNFVADISEIETTNGVTKITINSNIRKMPRRIKEKTKKSENMTKNAKMEKSHHKKNIQNV